VSFLPFGPGAMQDFPHFPEIEPGADNGTDGPSCGAVVLALRQLTPAPLPAVVFSSLAALSVPTLSDRCRIVITEEGLDSYLIERPLEATTPARPDATGKQPGVREDPMSGQLITAHTLRTPFSGTAIPGQPGYQGVVMHLWEHGYRPTPVEAALAHMAVSQAVALVHQQRTAARTTLSQSVQPGHGPARLTSLAGGGLRRKKQRPRLAQLHLVTAPAEQLIPSEGSST
jgi:hypothetical protein